MISKKIKERFGYALTELILAVTCSAFILGVSFTIYDKARKRDNVIQVTHQVGNAVHNIRSYYLFDGNYKGIKKITDASTDLVKKGFFSNTWSCSGKTCQGPDNVHVTIGTTADYKNFTLKFEQVKQYMCVDLIKFGWANLEAMKVNNKKATLPATVDFAVSKCKTGVNTLLLTF